MADISKIKTLDGTTYNIKDATARSSIPAAATSNPVMDGTAAVGSSTKYAKEDHRHPTDTSRAAATHTHSTQDLVRPSGLRGLSDVTLQTLVNTTRANRLAFLPADQIIIEKTVDGGTTWTDAGVADSTKVGLFSETRVGVNLPRINDLPNILCGLRITITGMKYNVPSGTSETNKYNYWNSNYVVSTERYCQLKELYFWLNSNNNSIGVKVERATGSAPNTWSVIFNDESFYMTGWSGCDYLRFSQGVFGGGTTQTGNHWNYRITLMTLGVNGSKTEYGSSTGALSIMEIRGYGDTWWTKGNEYMANDKIYTHDYQKNVTFPANVTATSFVGSLTGNASSANSATKATQDESGNNIKASYAASMSISGSTITLKNKNGSSLGTVTVPGGQTYTAVTSKMVTTTVPNITSVGSAPTLGTAIPADDITAWNAGSTPTLGTAIPADDITAWDAGSTPTLGTAIPADDITAWTSNTPTSASVVSGVFKITNGSAASLSYTAKSIPNVTSVGSVPSLSYTAKSIPNVTSVGSVPSLSYTAKSIPNVTSVGSAPTLGTAITVATGSLAADGSGATVATGITAS